MNKPNADCSELIKRTAQVIDNEVIERLFAIIQRKNVEVSMHLALVWAVSIAREKYELVQKRNHPIDEWVALLLSLFPYWNNFFHLEKHWEVHWRWFDGWDPFLRGDKKDKELVGNLSRAVLSWVDPSWTPEMQLLNAFVDILVMAEAVFWIPGGRPWDHIPTAISTYRNSKERLAIRHVVVKRLYERLPKFGVPVSKEKLVMNSRDFAPILLQHPLRVSEFLFSSAHGLIHAF
jgi:hypothetical protein